MQVFIIIGIVAAVFLQCVFADFMRNVAVMKGHGREAHAFALCFWFGLFGCLYVIALPDKVQQSQNQRIIELLEYREYEDLSEL